MRFVSSILHCARQSQRTYDPRATNDKLKCSLKTKQHSCPAYLLLSRLEHRYLSTLPFLVSLLCPFSLAFPFPSFLFSGDWVDVAVMLCTCLRQTSYSHGSHPATGCSLFSSDSKGECQCSSFK